MDKLFEDLRKRYKRREQMDNDFADWISAKGRLSLFFFSMSVVFFTTSSHAHGPVLLCPQSLPLVTTNNTFAV